MNLQEQIYRSRKLMVESHDDKLSLIQDILNDFLSFNNTIQFNVVLEDIYGEDDITNFSVEVVVDSSLFHMVSPNYNPEYNKHLEHLDDKISKLIDRYFGDGGMEIVEDDVEGGLGYGKIVVDNINRNIRVMVVPLVMDYNNDRKIFGFDSNGELVRVIDSIELNNLLKSGWSIN